MKYQLPIKEVISTSFEVSWRNKTVLLRVLALPIFMIVLFNLSWDKIFTVGGIVDVIVIDSIYLIFLTFILINCHRIFILGIDSVPKYGVNLKARNLKFFIWAAVLAIIFYIVWFALTIILDTILINTAFPPPDSSENSTKHLIGTYKDIHWWASGIAKGFAFYIIGRLCLVLPSAAIDNTPNIRWSWEATKNNGLKMIILIFAIPWFITETMNLIPRESPSALEVVLFQIAGYLLVTVEVAILSLSFKKYRDLSGAT